MAVQRKRSLKRRLVASNVAATGLALLVACALFMTCDVVSYRQRMVRDATVQAEMLGNNSTAAVSFGDEKGAAEVLSSLRADASVRAACLYLPDGRAFATYRAAGETRPLPESVRDFDHQFAGDALELVRPVRLDGQTVCSVYVRAGLDEFYQRVRAYVGVLAAVFVTSLVAAVVVAGRLQRQITAPVLALAQTARAVAADRNYSLRAAKAADDELGQLTDDFNEMLGQIQGRDAQLRAHHDRLEEQVVARTRELTETNVKLLSAKQAAEAASRAKSAFLANMSHEIRTPMTAILGYADLMLSPTQTISDRVNSLQVIRRNARHLTGLINDILDISKIEADRMTVEKLPCDLPQLVVDVASMLRARATEKGVNLRVEFRGLIPQVVRSDAMRLKQVLMNLVGNAIKFTHRGEVCLAVAVEELPGRGGPGELGEPTSRVTFDISDTGIGMTAEQIGRLFQPFVQADESMTRKFGGTGLGLVISQRLAALMGGGIDVRSAVGTGSTFTVRVDGGPLADASWLAGLSESVLQPAAEAGHEEVRLSGRVLLAEDGPDNRHLISLHLTAAGADVTCAENGRIAVDLVRAGQFDVILMDMQMPELDGYGATSELRRRGMSIPIIALTAHAMAGDREKCLAAGCTDYLTKPIDPDLLLRTVRRYIVGACPPGAGAAATPGPVPASAPAPAGADAGGTIVPDVPLPRSAAAGAAMRDAVAQFVSRLPERVRGLAELLDGQSLAELRRAVHQLKGAGSGYGLPQITAAAARAEATMKGDEPLDAVRREVEGLIALIRRVEGYQKERETHVAR